MLKNHVYPTLGQRSIDSIRPGDLRDPFLKLHAKGLSKASVALARDVVNDPLSYDVDAELKSVNPITGVIKALHNERDKREHLDYFTNGEVKLFLNICRNHFREHYPFSLWAFRAARASGSCLGSSGVTLTRMGSLSRSSVLTSWEA